MLMVLDTIDAGALLTKQLSAHVAWPVLGPMQLQPHLHLPGRGFHPPHGAVATSLAVTSHRRGPTKEERDGLAAAAPP